MIGLCEKEAEQTVFLSAEAHVSCSNTGHGQAGPWRRFYAVGRIWTTGLGTVFQVERPGVKGIKLSVASFPSLTMR